MRAEKILMQAGSLIAGTRNDQHGERKQNFRTIAELWSPLLGIKVTPAQVALCMALLKIARAKNGAFNIDDYIDGAGYMALAGDIGDDG